MPRRRGAPFTRADLESMPDDGRRYELIDGCLLVTPVPLVPHQFGVGALYRLLHAAAPADVLVLLGPFDVVLAEDTVFEPDLVAARRSDYTHKNLPVAPLLAVEVQSPSTRSFDLHVKRERHERAGTAAYWVVDPMAARLIAWDLRDGAFVQVADVSGDEAFEAEMPFPVRVVPSALV